MKRKIYIETSVISYLTARPSKNVIEAGHREAKVARVTLNAQLAFNPDRYDIC